MLAADYLSGDEVNQCHARSLGSLWGIAVTIMRPHDRPDEWSPPVIVCDFDSIREDEKPRSLEALHELAERSTIVLHSYHLEDEEAAALQAQGFVIRRYLDENLFKELKHVELT